MRRGEKEGGKGETERTRQKRGGKTRLVTSSCAARDLPKLEAWSGFPLWCGDYAGSVPEGIPVKLMRAIVMSVLLSSCSRVQGVNLKMDPYIF